MLDEGLDKVVLKKLKLPQKNHPKLKAWNEFLRKFKNPKHTVEIGLIGKYNELPDAYKSITESFIHAGAKNEVKVKINWIHSESLTVENAISKLKNLNGILVAPGFGERGIDGKIEAIKYARENDIPFFGVCLGMQMAVIEFARNVLNLDNASSTEMDKKSSHPVIDLMEEQKNITNYGGTMRLGAWDCKLEENSKIKNIYKKEFISERHRHRYEFNDKYLKQFEKAGMLATGKNPKTNLVEAIEIPSHSWFIGVQYHPEYKSTVLNPHPLFVDFVKAALEHSLRYTQSR